MTEQKGMEFPTFSSIDELLLNFDEETRADYITTDNQVKSTLEDLNRLDLPPATGPPPPPPFIPTPITKNEFINKKNSKDKKDKTRKMIKKPDYLISTRVIQPSSIQRSKPHISKPLVDPNVLSRLVNKSKESFPIYKDECFIPPSLDSQCKPWRSKEDANRLVNKEKRKTKSHQSANPETKLQVEPTRVLVSSGQPCTIQQESSAIVKESERLALELFDDPIYEIKDPGEMILLAHQRHERGVKAYSRYYQYHDEKTDWDWQPCIVLDYSIPTKLFLIEWIPSGIQKYVNRLNILFDYEDKEVFYKRIEYAVRTRNQVEKEAAYRQTIMQYESKNIIPLPKSWKLGILDRISRNITVKDMPVITSCMKEIEQDYLFSIKKADFEAKNGIPQEKGTIKSQRFAELALLRSGADKHDKNRNLLRKVAIATREMSDYMFSANPNVQKAIVDILGCLSRLLPMSCSFFTQEIEFPLDLSRYFEKTILFSETVQAIIVNEWTGKITEISDSHLGTFLNTRGTSLVDFKNSRAKDFFKLINIIMESQLQNIVIEGAIKFLQLFRIQVEMESAELTSSKASQTNTSKKRYKIIKPPLALVPLRFIIKITLNLQKESGMEVLRNLNHIPIVKVKPGNAIILDPRNLEDVQHTMRSIFYIPYRFTKKSIPKAEVSAYPGINFGEDKWIDTLDAQDDLFIQGGAALLEIVNEAWPQAQALLDTYRQYSFLCQEDLCTPLEDENDLEPFEDAINRVVQAREGFLNASHKMVEMTPFILDCSLVKEALNRIALSTIEKICLMLSDKIVESCDFLSFAYANLDEKISLEPGNDAEKWKLLKEVLEQAEMEFQDYDTQFSHIGEIWDMMFRLRLRIPNVVGDKYWNTFRWPSIIREHFSYYKGRLKDCYDRIANQIQIDCEYIKSSYEAYKLDVDTMNITDVNRTDDMHVRVIFLRERFDKLANLVNATETRIQLLQMEFPFSFKPFRELLSTFQGFEKLWMTAKSTRTNFDQWVNSYFIDLNADMVISKVSEWTLTINDLLSIFGDSSLAVKIVYDIKVQLDDFNRNISIITALRNPALKEVHWKQISKIIGLSLHDFSGLSLRQVMDLDLEMVQDILLDISAQATQENQIELKVDSMRMQMATSEFKFSLFGDTTVIDNIPEAMSLIEDLNLTCLKLLKLKPGGDFPSKIEKWMLKLIKAEEILITWDHLQSLYTLIQPCILGFEPLLITHFPKEVGLFKNVTKTMTLVTDILQKSKKFIALILRNDLHEGLKNALVRLEESQKAIQLVMNDKKSKYPRFYFLSDRDILSSMSCEKSPSDVNRIISKCFSGIKSLVFKEVQEDDGKQTKVSYLAAKKMDQETSKDTKKRWAFLKVGVMMMPKNTNAPGRKGADLTQNAGAKRAKFNFASSTNNRRVSNYKFNDKENVELEVTALDGQNFKERLTFKTPVEVFGSVEEWLPGLEIEIKNTIYSVVSHIALSEKEFQLESWLNQWPMQIVFLMLSVFWTKMLSNLSQETPPPVYNQLKTNLNRQASEMIRILNANRSAQVRRATEIAHSHLQYLLQRLDDLKNPKSLETLFFFKHRVEEDGKIELEIFHSKYSYGFEFLGGEDRLILLPFYNLKYAHLCHNLSTKANSLLYGPNGSQKSVIVTELSRIMGYRSFFIEIHPNLVLKNVLNVLQGSLLTQTWLVLHNINNGSRELLSILSEVLEKVRKVVLAAQISSSLPEPITLNNHKLIFEKHPQPLFATLNTRNLKEWDQLPSNLKTLFRPLALSTPQSHLIYEGILKTKGFDNARQLANGMDKFLRSISSFTGFQRFRAGLDVGTRVIDMAWSLKQTDTHGKKTSESFWIAKALFNTTHALFCQIDMELVIDTLKLVFVDVDKTDLIERDKSNWIQIALTDIDLVVVDGYARRLESLFHTLISSQHVILLGETMTGKSTAINLLSNIVKTSRIPDGTGLNLYKCFQDSLSHQQLFGYINKQEDIWHSGILANLFQNASTQGLALKNKFSRGSKKEPIFEPIGYSWIHVDGELNSSFCDSILQFMQFGSSHGSLYGQEYALSSHVKILFETTSLSQASPSFIHKCCILNFDHLIESVHIYKKALASELPKYLQEYKKLLLVLYTHLLVPTSQYVLKLCGDISKNIKSLTRKLVELFVCLADEFGQDAFEGLCDMEQYIFITCQYLTSLLWTFKPWLSETGQEELSLHIKTTLSLCMSQVEKLTNQTLNSLQLICDFPEKGTVFDYFYEIKLLKWRPWLDLNPVDDFISKYEVGLPNDIYPTQEIVIHSFFSRLLLKRGHHMLLCGPKGSGKTSTLFASLGPKNFPGHQPLLYIPCHSQLNSSHLQERIIPLIPDKRHEFALDQMKPLLVYVDDLNTLDSHPGNRKSVFGTLKMLIQERGIHELNDSKDQFMSIKDVSLAMTDSSALPNTKKLSSILRYVHVFSLLEGQGDSQIKLINRTSLERIFKKLYSILFSIMSNGVNRDEDKGDFSFRILQGTINLLRNVKKTLFATPLNPNYIFSMTDAMKILQSLENVYRPFSGLKNAVGVWIYQCHRFIGDGLSAQDSVVFDKILQSELELQFGSLLTQSLDLKFPFLVGNRFHVGILEKLNQTEYPIAYSELMTLQSCIQSEHPHLYESSQYGKMNIHEQNIQDALKIGFQVFENAQNILCVGQDLGNTLFISTLASWICGFDLIQLYTMELDKWNSILFNSAMKVLQDEKPVVFYLCHTGFLDSLYMDIDALAHDTLPNSLEKLLLKEFGNVKSCLGHEISDLMDFKRHLRSLLPRKLRFITCATSYSLKEQEYNQLFYKCNFLYSFQSYHFHSWGLKDVSNILKLNLQDCEPWIVLDSDTKKRIESLFYFIYVDVHSKCTRQALEESHVSIPFPWTRTFDAMVLFKSLYIQESNKLKSLLSRLNQALAKSQDYLKSVHELGDLHKKKGIEKDEITEAVTVFLKKMEVERDAVDKIKTDLRRDMELLIKLQADMTPLSEQITLEMEKFQIKFTNATRPLTTLTKNDIVDMRSTLNVTPTLIGMAKILCLMFKFDSRPNESIWDTGRRFLADPRIMILFVNFEKETMSETLIASIDEILITLDPPQSIKAAVTLYSWIQSIIRYHKDSCTLNFKRKQLAELKNSIEELRGIIEKNKTRQTFLDSILAQMKLKFDALMKQKDESTAQYREADSRHRSSQLVKPLFEAARERWKIMVSKLASCETSVLLNCVLASNFIAFLSYFDEQVRKKALQRWISQLKKISFFDIEGFSFSNFIIPNQISDYFASLDLPHDSITLDSLLVSKMTSAYPLLWDPYNRIPEWISAVDRINRVEFMTTRDADIQDKLVNSALRGVRIALKVQDGYIGSSLNEMLSHYHATGEYRLRINGDLRLVDKNFRIYFMTNDPLDQVCRYPWFEYVHFIQIPIHKESMKALLFNHLLAKLNPVMKEDCRKIDADILALHNRQELLMNRGIDFTAQMTPEDLISSDMHRTIIDNEEQIQSLVTVKENLYTKNSEKMARIFSWHIVSAPFADIYMSLDKMKKLNPMYSFDLQWYLELCTLANRELPPSIESVKDIQLNISHLLGTLFSLLSLGLRKADLLILVLDISMNLQKLFPGYHLVDYEVYLQFLSRNILVKRESQDKLKNVDKSGVANGDRPVNNIPWITPESWNLIQSLKKVENFNSFGSEFATYANRATTSVTDVSWEDVWNLTDPSQITFPTKWQVNSTPFDKMMILFCLRPDLMRYPLETFLDSLFKTKIFDVSVDAILQRFRFSSVSNPIWIQNQSNDDPIGLIRAFASSRNNSNTITIVSVEFSNVSSLQETLLECMRKGRWLILEGCELQPTYMHVIDHYYKYLLDTLIDKSSNFRLWLISRQPNTLLPTFLAHRSVKWIHTKSRELKQLLHESFPYFEENVNPQELKSNTQYRRFLFNLTTFYACLLNRRRFPLSLFHADYDFRLDNLSRAMKLFVKDFPSLPSMDAHLRLLNVSGEYAFGAQVLDVWDKRLLDSLFTKYMELLWTEGDWHSTPMRPLLSIYESSQKGDWSKGIESIKNLARDEELSPSLVALSPSFQYAFDARITSEFMDSFLIFYKAECPPTLLESLGALESKCKDYAKRLGDVCTGCFDFESQSKVWNSNESIENAFKKSNPYAQKSTKYLDSVLKLNIYNYSRMVGIVMNSLNCIICIIQGTSQGSVQGQEYENWQNARNVFENRVPISWLKDGHYPTCRPLDEWIHDLVSRLVFIQEWYTIRVNPTLATKGNLLSYDLSKMYSPRAFLDAILYDHALNTKERPDILEFDMIILSGRQSSPPERGVYVTGMHLIGAGWDYQKGIMRELKTTEQSCSLHCVWLQPVIMQDEAKMLKKVGSKRNGQKYECPAFIYKLPAKDVAAEMHEYHLDLYLDSYFLSTVESDRVWIEKNVSIVLECPRFDVI